MPRQPQTITTRAVYISWETYNKPIDPSEWVEALENHFNSHNPGHLEIINGNKSSTAGELQAETLAEQRDNRDRVTDFLAVTTDPYILREKKNHDTELGSEFRLAMDKSDAADSGFYLWCAPLHKLETRWIRIGDKSLSEFLRIRWLRHHDQPFPIKPICVDAIHDALKQVLNVSEAQEPPISTTAIEPSSRQRERPPRLVRKLLRLLRPGLASD